MKRLSGQAKYRILVGIVILILFYYAFKSLSDYNTKLLREVSDKRQISVII